VQRFLAEGIAKGPKYTFTEKSQTTFFQKLPEALQVDNDWSEK
jgi:hypothetical protein